PERDQELHILHRPCDPRRLAGGKRGVKRHGECQGTWVLRPHGGAAILIVRVSRTEPAEATVEAAPSKSYTHRALIAGALASGRTRIVNPLRAGDTELTAWGLESLGVALEWLPGEIIVAGCDGTFPATGEVTIDCGNSG